MKTSKLKVCQVRMTETEYSAMLHIIEKHNAQVTKGRLSMSKVLRQALKEWVDRNKFKRKF